MMFTGLVETAGQLSDLQTEGPGKRLTISASAIRGAEIGASIAVNGCCLTVVAVEEDCLIFEAGPETLSRTNLGRREIGDRVNLERSLKVGDLLGGHFVTGHIDGVGRLDQRQDDGEWSTLWFAADEALCRQMVSKGSIAVDGVSLTLVDVERERFSVQLIPHTLSVTTLGQLSVGDPVNLETDILAKYAQKAVGNPVT